MPERKDQARWLASLAFAGLAVYLCWEMVRPFAGVVVMASVLALTFFPLHVRIERRLGSPAAAAAVSTLLVVLVLVVPLGIVAAVLAHQLPDLVEGIGRGFGKALDALAKHESTRALVERLRENANLEHLLASERLKEGAGKAVQVVLQGTVSVVGGAAGILMNLCFTLFTLYYLFRDGRRIVEKLPGFLPLDPARGRVMVARTGEVLRASLYGVMVIAAVQGAMGGLAFWALGVPSPFVWGVVMTLFATIPMLGTFVVWAPAAAWLLLGGEYWRAGVLAVWGAVVIGSVDNFLRPKLVGSKVEMHELLVFFSVLGGLSVFGILGILVGPAVVAVTFGLLEALRQSDAPPPAGADPPSAS